jgi:type I restriction enzyme M protein
LAKRPVFIISNVVPYYVEKIIDFQFYNGFAEIQKKKSIRSLHEVFIKDNPNRNILEISSKSEEELGVKLSAFNLIIQTKNNKRYSVESAFQSSKAFENGGPYEDLLDKSSKEAKRDSRLKNSGKLTYFQFGGRRFELIPTTYFYNWLYINALHLYPDLANKLIEYDSFTDIVFNPKKSINCQARAVAIYVSLKKVGLLEKALKNENSFLEIVYGNINNYIEIADEQLSIWD